MVEQVWIDGVLGDGRIPVTDSSVLRGDGCFEVIRAYGGLAFAVEEHLDRLEVSAAKLEIPLPSRTDLADWIGRAARDQPDGAIRVVVSRGSALPSEPSPPVVVVFAHEWDRGSDVVTLMSVRAPWHGAGEEWSLAGAKVLSYAANLAATRTARSLGGDDALLLTADDTILEGPTFSVAWARDGVLETPALGLGILDSITRRHVIAIAAEAGIPVVEGEWELGRLDEATEVLVMSTIREVQPVVAVDESDFEPGEMTALLAEGFRQLVGSTLSIQEA